MDVVLLKDVEKLGPAGSIVHVKPGFARNFLLPRSLAVAATEARLKNVEEIKRQQARKTKRLQDEAEAFKKRLEEHAVSFTLSLGEDEKAFGSITAHDIVETLIQDGLAVEKHAVILLQPIKSLGVHEVSVKLHPNVTAVVKVRVLKAA